MPQLTLLGSAASLCASPSPPSKQSEANFVVDDGSRLPHSCPTFLGWRPCNAQGPVGLLTMTFSCCDLSKAASDLATGRTPVKARHRTIESTLALDTGLTSQGSSAFICPYQEGAMWRLRPCEQIVRTMDAQSVSVIGTMRIMRTTSDTKNVCSDTTLFACSYEGPNDGSHSPAREAA